MTEHTPQKAKKIREDYESAERVHKVQYGWHAQQEARHSQQPQYPLYQYSPLVAQTNIPKAQPPQQHARASQYANFPENISGAGFANGGQTHYGYPQPTTNTSSSIPPIYYSPAATGQYGQARSIHWSYGYPSAWAHGGDAYGYWTQQQQPQYAWTDYTNSLSRRPDFLGYHQQQHQQQQQQQQQQQPQPQYAWTGYTNSLSRQPEFLGYHQQLAPAYGSYLSPAGVPFDLCQSTNQPQYFRNSAVPHDSYRPTYNGPQSGSYKAFYGAHRSLEAERSDSPAKPSRQTESLTTDPPSMSRPHYSNDEDIYEQSKSALVRYSPEPSLPRARPYRGRQQDEYMEWDEEHDFDLAVPPPEGRMVSSRTTTRSHLFRSVSRSDHGHQPRKTTFEALDTADRQLSSRPWVPAYQAVQINRTLAPKTKIGTLSPAVASGGVPFLEHSIDPEGNLQTTPQGTIRCTPLKENRATDRSLRKLYVPVTHLKELAEGVPSSADKQVVFGRPQKHDDRRFAGVQTSLANTKGSVKLPHRGPHPEECPEGQEIPREESINPLNVNKITNTSRVHQRSMENSSSPSPPTKRTKRELTTSSPEIERTDTKAKIQPKASVPHATGDWANFAAHIARDDEDLAAKAREHLQRLGGDTFRPEFRETYKDQKGRKETTVHNKISGEAGKGVTAKPQDTATVREEERDTDDKAVAVDCDYDTDSSGGGVALSSLDLDTESWVAIKTGDENKGWKQD